MHLQAANTTTGYFAAAVDLGRLKAALELGVQRFDIAAIHARWAVDLRGWMTRLVFAWVQRAKKLHFDLRERGVYVRVRTQDDLGAYEYALDVMPGRKEPPGSATPPPT